MSSRERSRLRRRTCSASYSTTEELKDRLQVGAGDRTWYITMNLTQPPFDDIHVRKAMNLIMDKAALQRAWGGPIRGEIAEHIVPDSMFNGELDDYAPVRDRGRRRRRGRPRRKR